jgi:HEAT repeat protein
MRRSTGFSRERRCVAWTIRRSYFGRSERTGNRTSYRTIVSLGVVNEELQGRVEGLVRRYGAVPARQMHALRDAGEVPLDLLRVGAIEHPNPMVRRVCVDLLDHLDDNSALEVFRQALRDDPVPRVRRHAIHALTCVKCNGRPVVDAALDDLARCARDDPNARVRREATAALRSSRLSV